MTLMEDVARLQDRLAEAKDARARAQGARESAQASLERTLAELAHDFDVHDAAEGQRKLAELRDDLEKLASELNAKLDEIGV